LVHIWYDITSEPRTVYSRVQAVASAQIGISQNSRETQMFGAFNWRNSVYYVDVLSM